MFSSHILANFLIALYKSKPKCSFHGPDRSIAELSPYYSVLHFKNQSNTVNSLHIKMKMSALLATSTTPIGLMAAAPSTCMISPVATVTAGQTLIAA